MRLNNKAFSMVEIIVTFSIIMIVVSGLLIIVANYRNKVEISIERLTLDTFKDNITRDIYKDIYEKGIKSIDTEGDCQKLIQLNKCINITWKDGKTTQLGTSKINDENTIDDKYIYYDGIKYKLKDMLYDSDNLPDGRTLSELALIKVNDDGIFNKKVEVLENGEIVNIYKIDIDISHVDYKEDFGIHIVATDEDISLLK